VLHFLCQGENETYQYPEMIVGLIERERFTATARLIEC